MLLYLGNNSPAPNPARLQSSVENIQEPEPANPTTASSENQVLAHPEQTNSVPVLEPIFWRASTNTDPIIQPAMNIEIHNYTGPKPSVACEVCGQICEANTGLRSHQRAKHPAQSDT